MPESNGPHLEDRIDRYVRGELTAAEARELAQKSLDDPELFENLTFSALAKAAVADPSVTNVVRFPRKAQVFAGAGAIAAAAIIAVSLYSLRPSSVPNQAPRTSTASTPKPISAPILLGSNLGLERAAAPIYRGAEADSRSPRPEGSIVSIEDGVASIDLGSLDGLVKGSEVPVFRDERSTQPIGRLVVTTVFRDRARGRILDGREIQVNHQVRIAATTYLGVLLEQVDGLSGRGDSAAAKTVAEKAVAWAETANVPPGERAKALEKLAALEYQAGSLQSAEKHYQSVVDILNSAPAATKSPIYWQSLNNLGVLAELRGDRRKAEAFYTDALRASSGADQRAVETNLSRLKSLQ
jgi:tetratricopeptide (TPR) repeat protein